MVLEISACFINCPFALLAFFLFVRYNYFTASLLVPLSILTHFSALIFFFIIAISFFMYRLNLSRAITSFICSIMGLTGGVAFKFVKIYFVVGDGVWNNDSQNALLAMLYFIITVFIFFSAYCFSLKKTQSRECIKIKTIDLLFNFTFYVSGVCLVAGDSHLDIVRILQLAYLGFIFISCSILRIVNFECRVFLYVLLSAGFLPTLYSLYKYISPFVFI